MKYIIMVSSGIHMLFLANKTDIPYAKDNLTKLSCIFPKATIIPISALLSQGLKEVKSCVARNI